MDRNIKSFYFSTTDTTRKIVTVIADKLAANSSSRAVKNIDFTLPDARKEQVSFTEKDLVVVGLPVYAGRVPNILLKYFKIIFKTQKMALKPTF